MRVLWITGDFYPFIGGIQVYTDHLTRALATHCEVALITEARQSRSTCTKICHYPIAHLRTPQTEEEFTSNLEDISIAARKFAADVVHFSNAGIAVYRKAIPAHIPVLVTVHGNDLTAPWQSIPRGDVVRAVAGALNTANCVVAISEHTKDLLRRFGVVAPTRIMRHGCDLNTFRPLELDAAKLKSQMGIPADLPILLTVARFVPRKGHLTVLEALNHLHMQVHWIVVGMGPTFTDFVRKAQECEMAPHITALHGITTDDLSLLYNLSDLFVLVPEELESDGSLDSEGFGLAYQEASACGKPVIGSNVSGCKEAIIHGETGLLVPPNDSHALAQAINSLITTPSLLRNLGQNGAAHMRMGGGWPRLAADTYSLYSEILNAINFS